MIFRTPPVPNLRLRRRFFVFGAAWLLRAAGAQGRRVELTILNTTDMHGSIRQTPGVYVDHNDGSLLRCASLVRAVRRETPNVLLLDGGDVFQGTAESYLTRGGVMARAMNAMGYDAFAVGNHEFDWGVDALGRWLEQMEAVPLAANLLAAENAPEPFRRVRPFVVKEVDGIRVAIVGLTSPNLPHWFRGLDAAGLRVLDSRRALERIMPQVRKERPHVMVLLAHQGLLARDDDANEINAICRRFGEFDVVLGGHLHWVLTGTRIGRTHYAQAGSGARGVMRIDLTYDTVENAVVERRFEYLPVREDVPKDPEIAALVAEDLARTDAWLDTVLGRATSPIPYSLAGAGLSPAQQLLCAAIAEATEAEVVLHGVLSKQHLREGEVRMADVWRLVPYENAVGFAWLTPGEIREIMEEAAAYLGTERYFGAWGLRYEVHPDEPVGRRIRNLRAADGSALHHRRRLKVAFNSYHLAGGGGRFPGLVRAVGSPHARLEILPGTTREMVVDYVKRRGELTIGFGTNAVVVRGKSGGRGGGAQP